MDQESGHVRLNRAVIRREANGKTIWQPRIGDWYNRRAHLGLEFPGRFRGTSSWVELFDRLGVSTRAYGYNKTFEEHYDDPNIVRGSRKLNDLETLNYIKTPVGEVTSVYRAAKNDWGGHTTKYCLETAEDVRVYMYIQEHLRFVFNREAYDEMYALYGHLGLPIVHIQKTNMQWLIVALAGTLNTFYLMQDYPDLMDEFIKIIDRSHIQLMNLIATAPFEWVSFGDNVHSKILSPRLFEKYMLPAYQRHSEILRKAGIFTHAHFDGDCKELLPYIKDTGLDGIEAITPPPQGDVTLREARDALGDKFLLDGIAALLFDPFYPLKQLRQQAEECLNLFEGQLVLGISDEICGTGSLDRIEYVQEIVNDFNARH